MISSFRNTPNGKTMNKQMEPKDLEGAVRVKKDIFTQNREYFEVRG